MLSVLPAALDVQSWGPLIRKRPLPPSCLGDYHSAETRAKRLRQELLRLREWEQVVHQERMGALEGQGDSCDSALTVEPPKPQASPKGSIYYIEDASDSTTHPVHRPVQAASTSSRRCYSSGATGPCFDPFSTSQAKKIRSKCAPNLSGAQSETAVPVHTPQAVSHPAQLSSRAALSSVVVSSGPPGHLEEGGLVNGEQEHTWSNQSFGLLGLVNPLEGFPPEVDSDGAFVQQGKPLTASGSNVADDALTSGLELVGDLQQSGLQEENLPREETSLGPGGELTSQASLCGCLASELVSLLLPPLPPHYLGMPMPQRLRFLEFFSQASELLGLGVQAVYLATAMLDCCYAEAQILEGRKPGLVGMGRQDLHGTGLACLLHAYLSAKGTPASPLSVQTFCRLLQAGASRYPRVAAMLPVRAAALEQQRISLRSLLPLAVAKGSLSSSPWVYGSMLELRGVCLQKEHLVVFVSQLWSTGYTKLPRSVLAAANCCLLTGAAFSGLGDRAHRPMEAATSMMKHHHLDHLQDLHTFLCSEDICPARTKQASLKAPAGSSCNCNEVDGCRPALSEEVSV